MRGSLALKKDLAWVEGAGGRVVILDLDRLSEPPRVLADTAAAIWGAVDGQRTEEQIVTAVAEAYGLEPVQIRDDVTAFLAELSELGLVVASDQRP